MALRPCRLKDVHLPDQSLIVLNSRVFNAQQSECLAELCPHWGSALGGAYRPIMTGARLNARCWRVDRNVPEEVRSPLLGTPCWWVQEECTPKLYPAAKGEYMKDVLAELERLNVTAVVFGDPAGVKKWKDAASNRVIPGTGFERGNDRISLDELRKDFTTGGMKVMGEISLQYGGISPSDPVYDKYFALAEELDIPVAIHVGTGGSGRANLIMPAYRGSAGNPLLLEEVLSRHPKLRVQIMHAGYPMIDNLLTLLQANSHVYVDIAGLIWSYPIKEVNRYIERIVEAGFEDRVMFGTDQFMWPKLMSYSISMIQNADYLTPEQKRDILYNNVRFLRLETSKK